MWLNAFNPNPWFSRAAATLKKKESCELISWLFFHATAHPVLQRFFRWNWEIPTVILWSPPPLFLFTVAFWMGLSYFCRYIFEKYTTSLCQYTLLGIHRPEETWVTHTTRLGFQAVPFCLLWLCGSLLMSPCQLLLSWKASFKMCRPLSACILLKLSIKNNVTYEEWKAQMPERKGCWQLAPVMFLLSL